MKVNGKGNVINKFIEAVKEGEVKFYGSIKDQEIKPDCFIVDGNGDGYYGTVRAVRRALRQEGIRFDDKEVPPYYIVNEKSLVVMGDPKNDYRGSIESLFLRALGREPTGESKVDKETFKRIPKSEIDRKRDAVLDYIKRTYGLDC